MINPKNLLIVRTDRIGDVVLSLPLAGIIKKHYPECKVSFLVRCYTESIVKGNPNVDEILLLKEFENKISFNENINQLIQKNFDSALVVYPTLPTAWIIFRSGIKHRVGTGYRWYSFLFNHKVFEHRKYAERHELEFNVKMLLEFDINESIEKSNVNFNIIVDESKLEKVKSILKFNGWKKDEKIIIIHPGSGGSAVDFPSQKFNELMKKIEANQNSFLIVTGLPSEKKLCDEITAGTTSLNLAGELNLEELTALISHCDIFISNSTGPIHIASALNKFAIGFYPRIIECSAKRWGPYSTKGFVFEPTIDCTNCSRQQCEQLNCMNSIDTEDVLKKINEIFLTTSIQWS